jgi:chemotaxis protein MotB
MKNKIISIVILTISLASCIPPGKLSESLEANTKLNSKYDSLSNILKDTLTSFNASLNGLKTNVAELKDSVHFYRNRSIALATPVITEGDLFLNQILGNALLTESELTILKTVDAANGTKNAWLDEFKTDLKKYAINDADIKLNKGFVFVDIPSTIMFASGSATLNKKSIQMLGDIAKLLNAQPSLNFLIEGHTDSKMFKGGKMNNNWNLSVNRAAEVARILQAKYKIDPKRMVAAGRSEYMPMDNNNTKVGRSNNRRIRIVLMPSFKQLMNLNQQ